MMAATITTVQQGDQELPCAWKYGVFTELSSQFTQLRGVEELGRLHAIVRPRSREGRSDDGITSELSGCSAQSTHGTRQWRLEAGARLKDWTEGLEHTAAGGAARGVISARDRYPTELEGKNKKRRFPRYRVCGIDVDDRNLVAVSNISKYENPRRATAGNGRPHRYCRLRFLISCSVRALASWSPKKAKYTLY